MTENTDTLPSVAVFEKAVREKDYAAAAGMLIRILTAVDCNFGGLSDIEIGFPAQIAGSEEQQTVYFCTRMAAAVSELFSDPQFELADSGVLKLLSLQRWLNHIFASSPYINADHVLACYNSNPQPDSLWDDLYIDSRETLKKFAVLYLPESNVNLNWDALWAFDRTLAAGLCCALQSPRFIGTEQAFGKRAFMLQWAPDKFKQLDNLVDLPASVFHDVYMHCSYDIAENKHDVKAGVNHLIRRYLIDNGLKDRDVSSVKHKNGKPVMVVFLEHFYNSHSIYRTHSTSLRAARERFYIIGVGKKSVDADGRSVFDEFHELGGEYIVEQVGQVIDVCEQNKPAVLYMPSIGMELFTIFLSNLRLAPVQAVALGHPATTHSEFVDYVIVEDDYVGSEDCFSETLLRLPKDALPYVPSAMSPESVEYCLRENPETVHIGVAATTMKLNPYFLKACQAIRDRSSVSVHFHFAAGQSIGITHPHVERFIKSYLGKDATVYPHRNYRDYLNTLCGCDMMINPFPFGNTNGIIDMVTLGLVGVCKTGAEVHEHIDEGLFKRLGLPEWLITETVDDYIACAVRLAENHQERLALRRYIIENNGLHILFGGDPSPMGRVLMEKFQEQAAKQGITVQTAQAATGKQTTRRKQSGGVSAGKAAVNSEAEGEKPAKAKSGTRAAGRRRVSDKTAAAKNIGNKER